MKVPLSWLRDFVDVELAPEELARRLTMAGVEVEAIEQIGADWDRDTILVGVVERVEPHPAADRLVLATVSAGERRLTVVTGAPNVAEGQKVALALTGAQLWDGHSETPKRMTLKRSTIRGMPSEGMVCSEKELGLSDEHEGILVLPADAPAGVPLRDYLGDVVLDLEITPNLVHDFSVLGVAREVAALTGRPLHIPASPPLPKGEGGDLATVRDPDLCPRYGVVAIEGVTVGESPEWLKRRLTLAGLRPINNVADVTNYVMLEWGQPLHAFDRDRLVGGRIVVRRARPGERLETLDHVVRTLDDRMLVIADAEKPVGLAGVMGGVDSEIGGGTTSVLLESANFDMQAIRHVVQTLRLPTDASARFGRGLDPELVWPAAERAAALILALSPGARVAGAADLYPAPAAPRTVELPYGELQRLLGVTFPVEQVLDVLRRLDFQIKLDEMVAAPQGPVLRVTVPTYRQDVTQAADLVEEVIRIVGYDTVPATLPEGQAVVPQRDPRRAFADEVRDIVAGAGLHEMIAYSLTDEPTLDRLAPAGGWTTWWEGHRPSFDSTRLVNTLRSDWQILRPTLMADALETLAENLKYRPTVRLFEARPVYIPRGAGRLPDERLALSIALGGRRGERGLFGAAGEPLDYFDLKGVVEALVERLGVADVSFGRSRYATFHPGRAAELLVGGELVGVLGEVHPTVAANFGLTVERACLAEIDLDALYAKAGGARALKPAGRFQPVVQDFAVVVDEAVPAGAVRETILTAARPLAESARLFDVYHGEQVGAGKKSLAFEVTFAAPDRALADHELARLRERIAGTLQKRLKATLRA